jgi:tetratricopeptide (TPR) repeat protein
MGFRYYKRVKLGGGVHLNFSKTGIGISAGIPGARYSVHSSGRTVKTVGLPGTGFYYRKDSYAKRGKTRPPSSPRLALPVPAKISYPKAGLLAPKEDKAFVKGITAYMKADYEEALMWLRQVQDLDNRQAHVSEELFAGMCLIGLHRLEEAIPLFEVVIASHQAIPDQLMSKYHVGGSINIQITPLIEASVPISSGSAALLLAELYQHTGDVTRAIQLLESLGSISGYPSLALSLAELYDSAGRYDEVLRVTEDYTANTDDLTSNLLGYRAIALAQKGLHEAAIQTFKEALRYRSRDPLILRLNRYARAVVYEKMGRRSLARKDLERIYAEDPRYLDVADRLGAEGATVPKPTDV